MSGQPDFAVIIPHLNDVARLRVCLAALDLRYRSDVEVVVVDNGSSEDLSGVAAAFPWCRIAHEALPGAGPARNRGVAETSARWLLFLDADCRPTPNWLDRARQIAAEDKVIGGSVALFDETPPPRSGAEAFETVFAFQMHRYLEKKSFLGAGNLLVSRAVFERVGGFCSGVSEDVEWSRRAQKAGFTLCFDPELAVDHPSRQDWSALRRKWQRLTGEEYLLSGQNGPLRWVAKAIIMPLSAPVHAHRILWHPALSFREKTRALATLVRLRCARAVWMLLFVAKGRA